MRERSLPPIGEEGAKTSAAASASASASEIEREREKRESTCTRTILRELRREREAQSDMGPSRALGPVSLLY